MNDLYNQAAKWIYNSSDVVAFTGAGISVESGIPVFRGPEGLWSKYDPSILELQNFYNNPEKSWAVIKEIFYDYFGKVEPNKAHKVIGQLEQEGHIRSVITQNIDNLHQEGGSRTVYEFHGNYISLQCTKCGKKYPVDQVNLNAKVPRCPNCNHLLKPDFIFFGEAIPEPAGSKSYAEASACEVMLVIGTTGEVMPASVIPYEAKENGAKIIEVNTEPSQFTSQITDVFLEGKATKVMDRLYKSIEEIRNNAVTNH